MTNCLLFQFIHLFDWSIWWSSIWNIVLNIYLKTRTDIGPIRWMAPESISSRKYSKKSDVWSFGIVCKFEKFLLFPFQIFIWDIEIYDWSWFIVSLKIHNTWSVGNHITTWASFGYGFIGCWSENSVSPSLHNSSTVSLSNDVVYHFFENWCNCVGNVTPMNVLYPSLQDTLISNTLPPLFSKIGFQFSLTKEKSFKEICRILGK
jgi:serine/threonine protein kinase